MQLGYLLVAGESLATREADAPDGPFDVETLRDLRFETLPAADWSWTGPFPAPPAADGGAPVDAISAIANVFLPELEAAPSAVQGVEWRPVTAPGPAPGGVVDFRALTGSNVPAVVYARADWTSERERRALLWVEVDYYAQLWLNGERILALEGPHRSPVLLPITLRAGKNAFLLKAGAGSAGFSARLRLAPYGKD